MRAHAHRTPSHQAPRRLTLADVAPLALSLARREAHGPDDVDDLVQVGLLAYHRNSRRRVVAKKPFAHARTVLQRAMWRYYGDGSQQAKSERSNVPLDGNGQAVYDKAYEDVASGMEYGGMAISATAGLDGGPHADGQAELFELEDYFTALERACGPLARRIAENLVSPSGECAAGILEEAERKRACQQKVKGVAQRRRQPRGVKNGIRISHRLVREALGVPQQEWTRTLDAIKAFTNAWLGRVQ